MKAEGEGSPIAHRWRLWRLNEGDVFAWKQPRDILCHFRRDHVGLGDGEMNSRLGHISPV